MSDNGVDAVGGACAGFLAAALDHVGAERGDGVVAGVDEGAGPVSPLPFPAFFPGAEDLDGAGTERTRAGDADTVLIGEEQQGLGTGDEGAALVVVHEGGGDLGDGGRDGHRDGPRMARERQVVAAHGELELDEALAVDGLAGDHGDAEFLFHAGGAHHEAGTLGDVHHVKNEDHGAAEIKDLVNEVEVALEVGGVGDAHDAVGHRGVGAAAEEHVAENGLVGRAGGERVGTGQVDDRERLAVLRVGGADLLLDGNAGIVADLLFKTGKGVEECALATVRIADEGVNRSAGRGGRLDGLGHRGGSG